jgi:hypothetical protein
MKRRLALIAAITVSVVLSLAIRVPRCAAAGTLIEFFDEALGFGGPEISTNVSVNPTAANPLGGTQVYSKTFFKPVGIESLKVVWNGTGDVHGGVAQGLRARIDGADCNPDGPVGDAGLPAGWIAVQKYFNLETSYLLPDEVTSVFPGGDGGGGPGDMHDNSISYHWCCTVPASGGTHTVTVRLGNSCGTTFTPICSTSLSTSVFEEGVHVEIDGSNVSCGTGSAG